MQHQAVIAHTKRWVQEVVVRLNLCPFAKSVVASQTLRLHVSDASSPQDLAQDLLDELSLLANTPPQTIETSLLIHPHVLQNFLDYNDFLDVADAIVEEMGLQGTFQIASFHPQYRFADTPPQDPSHYTNRSPYPMLHILREDSITHAVSSYHDIDAVPQRNIQTLQNLGLDACKTLLQQCHQNPDNPNSDD